MWFPLNYDKINDITGHYAPSTIQYCNNQQYNLWFRSLLQRAQSKIIIEGIPDDWREEQINLMYFVLFINGFGVIANDSKYGLYFQPCTLNGIGFYYQPIEAIVSNPQLQATYNIGENCEVVKLTPDYRGITDILDNYAIKLALLDSSVDMNLINSKTPYILGGRTRGIIQALKKIIDKVNQGNPAIFYDSRINSAEKGEDPYYLIELFNKNNYITPELLQDFRTLIANFDAEIGINNVNFEKKERLLTDEVNSNNEDTIARCTVWLNSLNKTFDNVNKLFGTNFSAKLRDDSPKDNNEETTKEVDSDE